MSHPPLTEDWNSALLNSLLQTHLSGETTSVSQTVEVSRLVNTNKVLSSTLQAFIEDKKDSPDFKATKAWLRALKSSLNSKNPNKRNAGLQLLAVTLSNCEGTSYKFLFVSQYTSGIFGKRTSL
jgi:hypothetical protein